MGINNMKYVVYCDESCHLEHDNENTMVIGGIRCPYFSRRRINNNIKNIKNTFGISEYAEIKWNKVAPCNLEYFKAVTDYFFSCNDLNFRAVIVDKSQLRHDLFNQTHDDFYYKMYFYCLYGLIMPQAENYIYLDKKDTKGTYKIQKLKQFLALKTHDFDYDHIKRIQCVNSIDLPILQIADLLIGAIGYCNRDIPVRSQAKQELVEYIKYKSGYSLTKTTYLSETKFNLFFINLSQE